MTCGGSDDYCCPGADGEDIRRPAADDERPDWRAYGALRQKWMCSLKGCAGVMGWANTCTLDLNGKPYYL